MKKGGGGKREIFGAIDDGVGVDGGEGRKILGNKHAPQEKSSLCFPIFLGLWGKDASRENDIGVKGGGCLANTWEEIGKRCQASLQKGCLVLDGWKERKPLFPKGRGRGRGGNGERDGVAIDNGVLCPLSILETEPGGKRGALFAISLVVVFLVGRKKTKVLVQ